MELLLGLPVLLRAFLASLFTWSMTALGASFVFVSKRFSARFFSNLTAFSAGIMLSASFFSLLLPSLSYSSALPSALVSGLGFLFGGALIPLFDLLFSRFFKGKEESLYLLFGSVTLHNIPEGMVIGVSMGAVSTPILASLSLAFGIGIQNIPEGLCLAIPFRSQGKSFSFCFFLSALSGAVEVVSALLGACFVSFSTAFLPWILSASAGAMIGVVCSQLLPSSFEKETALPSLFFLFGFVIMMFLDLFLS